MQLLYSKPELKNLSQGARISFIRQFRYLSQGDVSDMLGLTSESKRRTMSRYEKVDGKPKLKRLNKLSRILLTDISLIKEYDFKHEAKIIYFILWIDELFPKMYIDLNTHNDKINNFMNN